MVSESWSQPLSIWISKQGTLIQRMRTSRTEWRPSSSLRCALELESENYCINTCDNETVR